MASKVTPAQDEADRRADAVRHATAREKANGKANTVEDNDVCGAMHIPPQTTFVPGLHVELIGLINTPELNGTEGILDEWIPGKGRWHVILEDGTDKLLKPENLFGARPETSRRLEQLCQDEDRIFAEYEAWAADLAEQGYPDECIPGICDFLQIRGYTLDA